MAAGSVAVARGADVLGTARDVKHGRAGGALKLLISLSKVAKLQGEGEEASGCNDCCTCRALKRRQQRDS
eukprot:2354998-Heterocapsa_arctica.AAC.1